MSNPYGITCRCILRRTSLPILPCDCRECDWFIHDPVLNNCFWVLADVISDTPGQQMSIEDIAEMEGLSVEEVATIFASAQKKYRLATRHWDDLE